MLCLFLIKRIVRTKAVLYDALELELDGLKVILLAVHIWAGDFSYTSPLIYKKVKYSPHLKELSGWTWRHITQKKYFVYVQKFLSLYPIGLLLWLS